MPELSQTVTAATFAQAVLEVSKTTPVLVDFWAAWCGPCKQLMPILDTLAGEYAGRFVLAKVNADDDQALTSQLGVRSLPTVVLYKDGAVADHFVGVVPEQQIRQMLDRHVQPPSLSPLDRARVLKQTGDLAGAQALLDQALEQHANDLPLLCESGELKALAGDLTGARAILAIVKGREPEASCVKRLAALLTFSEVLAANPDGSALHKQLANDPANLEARHALAVHRLLSGDYDIALEDWLDIMRHDRKFKDDLARKSLLLAFELIGQDDPRVAETRREMARMLF